ncbi:NADH:ubiquinone reductase (Na(+)-transporting) subunit B [Candidatus Marinimicrobia bacterium]|nr:NADH:ubiquinone reductase (Na(+)-transporting) subunit B [Candidatus Neomarinimicrobiota bacterium]
MLRRLLDKIEKQILSNDKLKVLHPLHDALDTFLFTTKNQTLNAPYVRDSIDLKRTMIIVVLALLPSFFFGVYNVGLQSPEVITKSFINCFIYGAIKVLPMYSVVFGVGGICEAIFAVIRKHEINEGFLVTGFLIPLVMPATVPLWMLAVATIFGVVIGKEIFGGTGFNVFNPALTARAFLFFAYPSKMSGNMPWVSPVDGLTKATPLLEQSSGATLSYNWIDMFYGFIPGSVGETSTLAVLLGAFLLIVTKIGSWRVMLSTCLGMVFTSLLLNQLGKIEGTGPMLDILPHYHFVMGSFAFGMVFMATDPVSSAQTNKGRWFYGFLIGFMVVIIRCINPAYPEGMMLAILFANAFAPWIDYNVIQKHIKQRELSYEK